MYGLHSLRSGGITAAVPNSKNLIPERLLKIHGRWKSDSAKDMCVEKSLENRFHVTKFLGLSCIIECILVSPYNSIERIVKNNNNKFVISSERSELERNMCTITGLSDMLIIASRPCL